MRYLILVLICSMCLIEVAAQDVYSSSGKSMAQVKREQQRRKDAERRKFSADKLVFGGGIGLSLGPVTNISVSPIIGYRFTDNFSAGIGFGYQYLKVKQWSQLYDEAVKDYIWKPLTANIYSPSIWARHIIWNNIFGHAEYQHNFYTGKEYVTDYSVFPNQIVQQKTNFEISSLWLGIGIKQPISDNVSFIALILYDVLPDSRKLTSNRIDMRLGINAGF